MEFVSLLIFAQFHIEWVDGIIDPRQTREIISTGIEMASLNPDIPAFNPGVIQT